MHWSSHLTLGKKAIKHVFQSVDLLFFASSRCRVIFTGSIVLLARGLYLGFTDSNISQKYNYQRLSGKKGSLLLLETVLLGEKWRNQRYWKTKIMSRKSLVIILGLFVTSLWAIWFNIKIKNIDKCRSRLHILQPKYINGVNFPANSLKK